MDQLQISEYQALRATIRTRGGLRLTLSLAGLAAWALTLVAILAWLPNPIAGSIPLLLLMTTFEVNRMLHVGVERIGRYLQVFYEDPTVSGTDSPAWESTAMSFGKAVPGAGGHPLLVPIFLIATLLNFLTVVLPGPVPLELGVMAAPTSRWWSGWSTATEACESSERRSSRATARSAMNSERRTQNAEHRRT
jgi:hypothetical protein